MTETKGWFRMWVPIRARIIKHYKVKHTWNPIHEIWQHKLVVTEID